jgi:hypothetical protein
VSALRERFPDLDLTYSIGGQISFDVFPKVRGSAVGCAGPALPPVPAVVYLHGWALACEQAGRSFFSRCWPSGSSMGHGMQASARACVGG